MLLLPSTKLFFGGKTKRQEMHGAHNGFLYVSEVTKALETEGCNVYTQWYIAVAYLVGRESQQYER